MPKKKVKNRPGEVKEGTVSRRSVLKIGAAAGAATVVAPALLTSKEALGFQTIAEPVVCSFTSKNPFPGSPPTHPFVDTFTAPAPAVDTHLSPAPTEFANLAAGEADRAPHPRWNSSHQPSFSTTYQPNPGSISSIRTT